MTTSYPRLDDLHLLLLVAAAESIGAAATQMGLTQPSVSRRIAALERTMGVPLLQRSPRGSVLSPAGKVVVGWATALLDAAEEFSHSVQTMREERVGTVRVAASMTIAEHLAPTWMARQREVSSETVVSLVVDNSTEVADAVESGVVDLGFVESPTIRPSLGRRRIGWDTLVVAVPPDHPWARRGEPITPADLAGEPLLVREPGSGTRETLDDALARHDLEPTTGLVLASNAALKSSAVAGMGPVVLSSLALAGEVASGRLVEVEVADLPLRRPLSAVWRRDERLTDATGVFLRIAATTV